MVRILFLFAFLFSCLCVRGQEIVVRERIGSLDIPHKEEVVAHWCTYVEAAQSGQPTDYLWLEESRDILPGFVTDFYTEFNQELVDLQVKKEGCYRLLIHAGRIAEPQLGRVGEMDYQVYVVSTPEGWRLVNSFDLEKSAYRHYALEQVDLYTQGRPVSREEVQLVTHFIETFASTYGVTMKERLTYVCFAGSAARALSDMGVIKYDQGTDGFSPAQYIVGLHSVVAPSLFYFHELVHAIMIPNYPDAPLLLHEGMAVFAGETKALKAERQKEAIRYLSCNRVDFSTYGQLNQLLKENGIVYYAVACALIEHCLSTIGVEATMQLFELLGDKDLFEQLGIAPMERTQFVYGLFGLQTDPNNE